LGIRDWLIKHRPPELDKSLLHQAWWQAVRLSAEIKAQKCQILFSADASTFCRFAPMVVLNQNMLAYDKGVLALFGWGKDRFQQTLMYLVQRSAFRAANASIFLTQHAGREVQRRVGKLSRTAYIAHGVAEIFRNTSARAIWPSQGERSIRCLYVSPVFEYKHQVEVVFAIEHLRKQGLNIELTLVGGGGTRALGILHKLLYKIDLDGRLVSLLPFLPSEDIASLLSEADIFVFASSCETFGIALVEAMAVGLPIACSNRSSMQETLADAGEYFDPENIDSICSAIRRLVDDPIRRAEAAIGAKRLATQYTWSRCASQTWAFVTRTHDEFVSSNARS
jgi:glycosyltransferase involved in cell wall biosynthesis